MKTMSNTRTGYVMKNTKYGILSRVISIGISLIVRTCFIRFLGAEYLGIEGLFSNILVVLSLTELGVGNVLTFSLYKPIAENDNIKIASLINYYSRIYKFIVVGVCIIGLVLVPFLGIIVKSTLMVNQIILFYLIYLADTVLSYFSICYVTLIKAAQKQYIIDIIITILKVLSSVLQIFFIVKYKNFYLYLIVMIMNTMFFNIIVARYVKKHYSLVRHQRIIDNIEKTAIINNVKSTFLYKFGVIVVNNTDNILISVLLSTVYVGYYSNYFLIVSQISIMMNILCTSLIASIGNLSTEGNKDKALIVFRRIVFLFHCITMICSIELLVLLDDFVRLWVGNSNALNKDVVYAIVISFYIQNVINPVWMYREAYGLFKDIRFLMLFTAGFNLIFSVIGGKLFGIAGIISATALARTVTTVWYEPRILFKKAFGKSSILYFRMQIKYFFETILLAVSILVVDGLLNWRVNLIFILVRMLLIGIILLGLFAIMNIKSEEMDYWKGFIKERINLVK